MLSIVASQCSVEENEDCLLSAYGNLVDSDYVAISLSKKVSDQDRELGVDGLHVEVNDQSRSCYNGVQRIELIGCDRMILHLSDVGQRELEISQIRVKAMCENTSPFDLVQRMAIIALVEFEVKSHD